MCTGLVKKFMFNVVNEVNEVNVANEVNVVNVRDYGNQDIQLPAY